MEQVFVHDVYNEIADHFDETRTRRWPGVLGFLDTLPSGSLVLDLGCGNGKYLSYRQDLHMHACDACPKLIRKVHERYANVITVIANGMNLPYVDNTFDAIYAVAVLHHLHTMEHRQQFLGEMRRVLKPGGRALVTVWAQTACRPTWKGTGHGDFLVPWHNKNGIVHDRYYHVFSSDEIIDMMTTVGIEMNRIWFERDNWYVEVCKPS